VRLFRYTSSRGGFQPRVAIAAPGERPVDIADAWCEVTGARLEGEPTHYLTSAVRIIEQGPEVWSNLSDVARAASHLDEMVVDGEDPSVSWLCPLDRTSSLRDFLAFEDHVKRAAARRGDEVPDYWYEAPIYYKGNHRQLIGPEDECRWPSYTETLDFELELAMVVGRRGREIPTAEASQFIFGFTVFNDFSARDIQAREMSAWLGPAKGKDFANSLGPCIVTVDEVGAEPDLEMICRVNGEEWGRARSSDARWRWADMISHVSMAEDIYPGDVYGSGTPGGCCGLDQARSLEPGDVVELEIERIGLLRNKVGSKPG
jgi:2-keto-4-pentenoate hydratase/2-oxohepta-3-ene-1,7-dioic acid hydratase in catechol pathway